MSEQKQYTLEEIKAELTNEAISEQFSDFNINFDSGSANFVDDSFTIVVEALIDLIDKIYE